MSLSRALVESLVADTWSAAAWRTPRGDAALRYRDPVLGAGEFGDHRRVLRILWTYGQEGQAALPDDDESIRMDHFEATLRGALETTALAYLAAVLTFDGARQWVFYTPDVGACGARLAELPDDGGRYPIEMDAFDDPEGAYLRGDVLRVVQGGGE